MFVHRICLFIGHDVDKLPRAPFQKCWRNPGFMRLDSDETASEMQKRLTEVTEQQQSKVVNVRNKRWNKKNQQQQNGCKTMDIFALIVINHLQNLVVIFCGRKKIWFIVTLPDYFLFIEWE